MVRGPSMHTVEKVIIDDEMLELIKRLEKFGPPEITVEYSILRYRGIGDFVERYREIPGILGALVEIGRHIDSKLTIGLSGENRKRLPGTGDLIPDS